MHRPRNYQWNNHFEQKPNALVSSKNSKMLAKPYLWGIIASAALLGVPVRAARADDYPLSLQLQVLERDLTSADYVDVVWSMIPTDLAAEWQRVATSDNHQ